MREVHRGSISVGITLALGVWGCGGRVDQVNVGSEQSPGELTARHGRGGETQAATPTVVGPGGSQGGQEVTPVSACLTTRKTDPAFDGAVGTFSDDGSLLALVGNYYSPLQVFRMADNTVTSAFQIPPSHFYYRSAISPDNSLLAAAGGRDEQSTGAVAVYRVADGALLTDLPVIRGVQHSGGVVAPDFSHDGRLLVTAGGDAPTVEIWSVPEFRRVRTLAGPFGAWGLSAVRFSPDDTRLLTASAGTLAVWNVANGSLVWSRPLSSDGAAGDAMFSPDGTEVISMSLEGYSAADNGHSAIRLWNATNGAPIQQLSAPDQPPASASLSYYDDDHILIGDDRRGARIWARGTTGLFAPWCFLTSERPPPSGPIPGGAEGPATVSASRGGRQMYVHGLGSWLYEQAPP